MPPSVPPREQKLPLIPHVQSSKENYLDILVLQYNKI